MAIILTRKVFSYWESVKFTRADTSFQILILTWKVVLSSATNTMTCSPWSDELTLFFLKKCLPNTQVGKTLVFRVKMVFCENSGWLSSQLCFFLRESKYFSVWRKDCVCTENFMYQRSRFSEITVFFGMKDLKWHARVHCKNMAGNNSMSLGSCSVWADLRFQ